MYMYMYMYVYVSVYVCICMYVYVYVCLCVYISSGKWGFLGQSKKNTKKNFIAKKFSYKKFPKFYNFFIFQGPIHKIKKFKRFL